MYSYLIGFSIDLTTNIGISLTSTWCQTSVGLHPPDGQNALFVDIEDWLRDLEDYFLAKFGDINDLRKISILGKVFG